MTDTEAINILNGAKSTISTEKAALLGAHGDLGDMGSTVSAAVAESTKRVSSINENFSYVKKLFGG